MLYKKIISGEDKRIKLVKAMNPKEQLVHVKDADLVIWACGYQTKPIPIYDHNRVEL